MRSGPHPNKLFTANRAVQTISHTHHCLSQSIQFHSNMTRRHRRTRQHHILNLRAQTQQSVRIVRRVNLVSQRQICQVVHIDSIAQGHRDGIFAQLDRVHHLPKAQIANGFADVVIVDQDAVRWGVRRRSATHHSHETAAKEHFDQSNPSAQLSIHRDGVLWMQIVNREARGRSNGQTASILVECASQKRRVGDCVVEISTVVVHSECRLIRFYFSRRLLCLSNRALLQTFTFKLASRLLRAESE